MKPADFHKASGKVIKIGTDQYAFVPAPLPPVIEYDAKLVLALSRADTALSALDGLPRQLPVATLLVGPYLRREAVLSSRIEGTEAGISDLLLDEAEPAPEQRAKLPGDVLEVRNYVMALEQGIEKMKGLPLSLRLVREIHRLLMSDVGGTRARGGEFRTTQNWIGPPGSRLETASFVPPPPPEMKTALHDWERFVHQRDLVPDLIQCALMHQQFETIHPFVDGNGRIGRILITLFLIDRGRLAHPILYLSEYLEANRQEYYERLQRVRTHGDWSGWLHYFLAGVAETSRRGAALAGELVKLREKVRAKVQSRPRALQLVDRLFVNPYVTAANVAALLQVSAPTARGLIELLESAGILKEITRRAWGRMWVARGVLAVMEKRKPGQRL
jgi:Fic family protein